MDCPLFLAREKEYPDELKPFSCPLVYCPPNKGIGNFTFSVCAKLVDDSFEFVSGYISHNAMKKVCLTDYNLCDTSCGYLKSDSIGDDLRNAYKLEVNTTSYTAVGCAEGALTMTQNSSSSVFPSSSIVQKTVYPNRFSYAYWSESSSSQLHSSIAFPCLLAVIVLLFNAYAKKI